MGILGKFHFIVVIHHHWTYADNGVALCVKEVMLFNMVVACGIHIYFYHLVTISPPGLYLFKQFV